MIECKSNFEDVATVLDPDAGNHADLTGLFAATHRPVPGDKSVAAAPPISIDDASVDAYATFSGRPDNDWPIIIPVLGEPGTGKSHLVRWVWNQFRRVPDESFAMVYIPRIRMNIAGVLERLLEAALKDQDASVRSAAEELLTAARATYQDRDPDRVARELRAEIVYQLKAAATRPGAGGGAAEAESVAQRASMIAALEVILSEGSDFERYLHSPESAIGRRVAVLVEGRPEEKVHEVPAGFSVEELRSYSPRVAGQSREFQDTVRRLVVTSEWGPLELAVSLLNDGLDRAVMELITKGTQGRGLTFTQVFRRLRESLYVADRELVIFVEELKLLGGVERELLESFLDNEAAEGLAPICRIRAMIACTSGEWKRLSQDIGTLTSRLNAWRAPEYVLDGSAALSEPAIEARLVDMAAHYLNAARVGVKGLEDAFREAEDAREWVPPNGCDSCAVRERCHATFGSAGANGADFGLFPFNRLGLIRTQENAQLQEIHTPLVDGLNPRILLTGVLAPMLKHLSESEDGAFPDTPLARELAFSPAAEATIRQGLATSGLDEGEVARSAVLLEIWGEASPPDDNGLVGWTVDQRIPDMLGTVVPPAVSVRPTVVVAPKPIGATPQPHSGLPEAVDQWRNGSDLVSGDRRDLRNRVNELVTRYIDWNDFAGVGPRSTELLREAGIGDPENLILFEETTASQPTPSRESVRFEFHRNDDDYTFLRAVADSAGGSLQPEELIVLAEGLKKRAKSIEEQLSIRSIGRAASIRADHPGLVALLVTSLAYGLDPASTEISEAPTLLAGLVAASASVPGKAAVKETRELFEVLEQGVRVPRDDVLLRGQVERATREDVHKWLLRRIGLRRSGLPNEDEQVQMLDAVVIYDALLNFASSPRISPLGVGKPDPQRGESAAMAQLATTVYGKVAASLQHEIERSRSALADLASFCGLEAKDASATVLTKAIDAAASAAASADALVRDEAMVPGGDIRGSFRKFADLFDQVRGHGEVEDLGQLLIQLAKADSNGATRIAAARLYSRFTAFNNYREAAEAALSRAETYLEYLCAYIPQHHQTSSNPIIDGFPDDYRQVLDDLSQLVDGLTQRHPGDEPARVA